MPLNYWSLQFILREWFKKLPALAAV